MLVPLVTASNRDMALNTTYLLQTSAGRHALSPDDFALLSQHGYLPTFSHDGHRYGEATENSSSLLASAQYTELGIVDMSESMLMTPSENRAMVTTFLLLPFYFPYVLTSRQFSQSSHESWHTRLSQAYMSPSTPSWCLPSHLQSHPFPVSAVMQEDHRYCLG